MNQYWGKILVVAGIAAITAGVLIIYSDRLPLLKYIGRLPGDINIKRENFSFHFPVVTCILLSILASIIFRLISKLK